MKVIRRELMNVCPYCGSDDTDIDPSENTFDSDEYFYLVWCNACEKKYWEVYTYSHTEIEEEDE